MAYRRSTPKWVWLPASPVGGAGGAAYSKLFRNEALPPAELLAREVLQNSWDAALVNHEPDAPAFRFKFRFVSLKGAAKSKFLRVSTSSLFWSDAECLGPKTGIYRAKHAIAKLGNKQAPLRLLYLEDYGTHGMFGDPAKTVSSHLYKALYILGSTSKDESRASQGGSSDSARAPSSAPPTCVLQSPTLASLPGRVTKRSSD